MNNRLERCIRILVLVQRGDAPDAAKLAKMLNVTRRTIFRDLAALKEMGLEVVFDPSISSYCVHLRATPENSLRLSPDQLGDSLQEAMQHTDALLHSQAEIIRRIALSLTSRLASQGETLSQRQAKQTFAAPIHTVTNQAVRLPDSAPTDSAPTDSAPTDFAPTDFAKLSDKICFLTKMISAGQSIDVRVGSATQSCKIKLQRLAFAGDGWTVAYVTESNETLSCQLNDLQVLHNNHPTNG